jgi:hypothetical protein
VQDGAAIYVCGSLQGMAGGVHDALIEVLGAATVDAMMADGRYRRDVYWCFDQVRFSCQHTSFQLSHTEHTVTEQEYGRIIKSHTKQ